MKKTFLTVTLALAGLGMCHAQAIPSDAKIEQRIHRHLKEMTLEEKVGQMCELNIDRFTDYSKSSAKEWAWSKTAIDSIFRNYKIGSVLNAPNTQAQTPEFYARLLKDIQEASMKYTGTPDLYGLDQNHGTTYSMGGTLFPQNLNMGATFNRELTRRAAEICAYETRASMVPWTYNPTVDLARNPAWPRFYENYGEDAYVNAEMGREAVLGYQGNDPNHVDLYHIAACMKHYMGLWCPCERTRPYPLKHQP